MEIIKSLNESGTSHSDFFTQLACLRQRRAFKFSSKAKLLTLSNGRLEYEYHLKDKLDILAQADAESTLLIMRSLLLSAEGENARNGWLRSDAASVNVFTILYAAQPENTTALINDLWEKKGRAFWGLKQVLK